MLNKYPLWKNLLIVFTLGFACLYALPNLYPDDFALQITGSSSSTQVDQSILDEALTNLKKAGIAVKSSSLTKKYALIRVESAEDQLKAQSVVKAGLSDQYLVALNMAATTPKWLRDVGASPMKLGLDLRGGVHFLLEVDMEKALTQRLDSYVSELKSRMRTEKIRYRLVKRENESSITMKFKKEAEREAALSFVQSNYPEFIRRTTEKDGDFFLNLSLSEAKIKEIKTYAIEQNLTTLRNRVNELGVAEPLIQRQGSDRIVVELPGVQDTAAAKRVLGQTANLEMRLEAKSDASPATTEEFGWRNNPARPPARLEKDVIIRGDNVSNANAAFDQNGLPQVNITLDSIGGRRMGDITRTSVGRRMAVLFVEQHSTVIKKMVNGKEVDKRINKETKKIISLATIQSAFSNSFRITGLDSAAESSELALLLRAGSLAAPVYFVEERTVGPSMGQHNINSGILSVEIGFALVLIFMIAFYRLFGLVANIALMANVVMIIACMSLISATLTMPGIAGIVLTVGMAVDANVLIYERIKEELANGMSPQAAIEAGYDRAFTTIFDANITTLIAAVILFAVGTGPVKGFAVTLSLGIITSMFTAIMLTRSIINKIYGGRKITRLSIGYTYTKQSKAVQGKSS